MSYRLGYGLAALGGAFIFGIVLAFIGVWVFTALVRWKVFEKAGVPGWKSLIPFYGDYVEYGIVWETKWFWVSLAATVLPGILLAIPLIGPLLAAACGIVLSVLHVVRAMQKAHAFGKDDGFAVGLMVIGFVFELLIAFDANVFYQGPQPTPALFQSILKNNGPAMNYDPYTGEPLNKPGPGPEDPQ